MLGKPARSRQPEGELALPVDDRSVAARLFAILDAFAAPAGATSLTLPLTAIAQRAGLPLSTTHRPVAEWVSWGGLSKHENGQDSLGMKLWELGVQTPTARNLRTIALPYLEDRYETTREHVHLAILDGRDALYLEKLSGHHSVRLIARVGARLPLRSTGVGLVLLAHAPPDVVQRYLAASLERFLPRTVTEPEAVRKRLAEIRLTGIARMSKEMAAGSSSLAAPARPKRSTPRVTFVHDCEHHTIDADFVVGADGFHGICRASIPSEEITLFDRSYRYAWLGILADVAPASDELIYALHEDGFAMLSMRSPVVSRLYLQVDPADDIKNWSDGRIREALHARLGTPSWTLNEGPITDKSITPMRSFVVSRLAYGNVFLVGDAGHIVPPTGAKGLNSAISDVTQLASALTALIKPGTCPWKNHVNAWRPTHIHFSLFGTAFTQRLITQMYFPGDPLFALDPIYQSIASADARARLIGQYDHSLSVPEFSLGYTWDIVLTGPKSTWMESEEAHD